MPEDAKRETLKRTPLYPAYAAAGAHLTAYAGWELPVQFAGIGDEHRAVRTGAGLFDVSHMGELRLTGRDALTFLQRVLTNDCARLTPGRVLYSPMCYPDGGCVDDLLVYMMGETEYLLVVNAANTAKDLAWLLANTGGYAVALEDASDEFAQLALQGPAAAGILAELMSPEVPALKYYSFAPGARVAGRTCLLSRTGYTGEDGYELYLAPEDAPAVWDAILATGLAVPAGLGARDTLRLEAGMPLYGHELSPEISPLEAGLARFVALGKQGFIGRAALEAQAVNGPPRRLAGLELLDRGIARAGHAVLADGEPAGTVTSGTLSPYTNRAIAMALLTPRALAGGATLAVEVHNRRAAARMVPLPFYRRRQA